MILLFLFSIVDSTAQTFTLAGKVTNEKGEPVPGVSVVIKGKSKGVSTGSSGEFGMVNLSIPITIVCSSVGYERLERKLERKDFRDSVARILITLRPVKAELEEVVVTSLGSARSSTSYSYSTSASAAPMPAIRGKVSGITVGLAVDKASLTRTEKRSHGYSGRTATDKRSGLLTAGELNDFKKWNMWEDYNKTDFKTYSEEWELYATERYCVQLQNTDKKALTGEKLYLLSKTTGDTLWTAISDNTGKAELWNRFNEKRTDHDLVIVVEKEQKQFSAIPFTQGINRIVINRSCTVSNKAEIAFLVDATGSMQDEINYLKEELEDVLTRITVKDPGLDLHTGAVFYRDNGDAYITKVQEFTGGIGNTTSFIKQQDAGGGGDYPEAMNEGLKAAIQKLTWSTDAITRIIFLLMDAPPHDETKKEIATLTIQAATKGIRIVPVACSGTDKATEFIMRSIALATNGSYLFLTDDSGIGNSHIKPTTDEIKVELLNDLLQRTIEQMCFVNDCEHNTTGLEPVATYTNTEKVKIFPNPTTGPVMLQTTKSLKEIFIADFTGKLLMRILVKNKSDYHFDLTVFPAGTYFIKYITEENKTGTEKLVLLK